MNQFSDGLTKKLGIRYPIIQAPMAGGATTPELVAAVSNSGGLGSLGAGYMQPNDIRRAIQKIRSLTNKPFAVNLFIPEIHSASLAAIKTACDDIEKCSFELGHSIKPIQKPYSQAFDEQINVIIEERVPVFSFTFGMLDTIWKKQLKSNNTLIIGTATTLLEAKALEDSQVDFIVAQGLEAGGHRGSFLEKEMNSQIQLFDLVSQCMQQIKTPIIASGGIMNGKYIAEIILSGAVGVQLGTAFLSCHESGIHNKYKQQLLSQKTDSTILTRAFSGKLARGIRNKFIDRMQTNKSTIVDYPIQNALTKSIRKKAGEMGLTEFMSMWAGQGVSLCRDVSTSELMQQLVVEMKEFYGEK